MLLSIIIINYKTFDLTKSCIDSVYKYFDLKMDKNVEVIVVDNGSGEEEISHLQKLRDKLNFKLLTSEKNLGFAAGCNFASTMAEGEILLFLNSDAKMENGITQMADDLVRESRIGILGGKIVAPDGAVEKSAGKFYNIWQLFIMLIGGQRFGLDRFAPTEFKKVNWVSGGFMMVKKDVFEKLSGFDEDYFMYLEDMDLCLRASKLKYETYYFPDAKVIHRQHGSASREFAILNIYRSMLTFYRKNTTKLEYTIAVCLLYLKAVIAYVVGLILGKKAISQTYREVLQLF